MTHVSQMTPMGFRKTASDLLVSKSTHQGDTEAISYLSAVSLQRIVSSRFNGGSCCRTMLMAPFGLGECPQDGPQTSSTTSVAMYYKSTPHLVMIVWTDMLGMCPSERSRRWGPLRIKLSFAVFRRGGAGPDRTF
jgi:hypothetical protein